MPFLNTGTLETPVWARIGKSTIFNLAANAQTETNDFIEDEMPTEDVKNYTPELPQELQCNKGDPAFDYVYDMFYMLPVGEDVKKNVLIVFAGNQGTDEEPEFKAWNTTATLILKEFDTVAEKITFSLKFSKIERGTATITDKKPVFTLAE